MTATARLKLSRAAHPGAGDVMPWEFVRLISGCGLGIVVSISGGFATCIDLNRPGHREIIHLSLLVRA